MALLAVAVDMAVLEITPHLEHFRSSRLLASAGTLWTREHAHRNTDSTSDGGEGGMMTGGFAGNTIVK